MEVTFDQLPIKSGNLLPHEHVERKGIGHPDTICDQIAEKASEIYSRFSFDKYGRIPHHWFDKVILVGGESVIEFSKGELVRPYTVIFTGKVCYAVGDEEIPVEKLLKKATVQVLSNCLVGFDPEKHVEYEFKLVDYHGAGRDASRYRPQSPEDLGDIDAVCDSFSNDCNLVTGYAPLSDLEMMVLEGEMLLNSKEFKKSFPCVGTDIKVFGVRDENEINITFNVPFLGAKVSSMEEYRKLKENVKQVLVEKYSSQFKKRNVHVHVNPQDRTQNPYLTAIGSAADTGDVGLVGRGNRINGLITPMRPMSIEAPAGKNPIDHTGKILSYFARELAAELHQKFNMSFYVNIFIAKGSQLTAPDSVLISSDNPESLDKNAVQQLLKERLNELPRYCKNFVFGGEVLW